MNKLLMLSTVFALSILVGVIGDADFSIPSTGGGDSCGGGPVDPPGPGE